MSIEQLSEQLRMFETLHGNLPQAPVRVSYFYGPIECEGDLHFNGAILGYPGMISAMDESITNLKMLHDKTGLCFESNETERA